MDYGIIQELTRWTSSGYGYTLLFLGMLPEGPVITATASFGASLGLFNVWLVFLISVLGNFLPDTAYYLVGFWGRRRVIDKYGKYMMLPRERLERLEQLFHANAVKTMFAVKLLPFVATPGLIIAGIARMPLRQYLFWSIVITIPSSLAFVLLGYYFGEAYREIVKYVGYGGYIALGALAVFALASYLYKKFSKKIAEKVEKI